MPDNQGPIGPNDDVKVSKIETFVLKNSWVFVKISTDAGIVGWGEMLKDDAKACAAGALEVAHYLVGQDPRKVAFHWQAIHRGAFYRGGPIKTAISSGIDMALWDITGKCYGVPVYKLLGGPTRKKVRLFTHLSGSTPSQLAAQAKECSAEGYTAVRLYPFRGFRSARLRRGPRPRNHELHRHAEERCRSCRCGA